MRFGFEYLNKISSPLFFSRDDVAGKRYIRSENKNPFLTSEPNIPNIIIFVDIKVAFLYRYILSHLSFNNSQFFGVY